MTQTLTPVPSLAWCQALQTKLMAALDAAWAILEHSDDPVAVRRARDRAKAVGELAAVARKVALIVPAGRAAPVAAPATSGLAAFMPAETALAPSRPRPNTRGGRSTSSRAGDAGGCDDQGGPFAMGAGHPWRRQKDDWGDARESLRGGDR